MAGGDAPKPSAEFNQLGERDSARETERSQRLSDIKARLRGEHIQGRTPDSVSRVEQNALEEMAPKPRPTLDLAPGESTQRAVHETVEQRRADRIQAIKARLRDTSEEIGLSDDFDDAHDYER